MLPGRVPEGSLRLSCLTHGPDRLFQGIFLLVLRLVLNNYVLGLAPLPEVTQNQVRTEFHTGSPVMWSVDCTSDDRIQVSYKHRREVGLPPPPQHCTNL